MKKENVATLVSLLAFCLAIMSLFFAMEAKVYQNRIEKISEAIRLADIENKAIDAREEELQKTWDLEDGFRKTELFQDLIQQELQFQETKKIFSNLPRDPFQRLK